MQQTRRFFLNGSLALMALISLPRGLWAAVWPQKSFAATKVDQALKALLGSETTTPSDKIKLKVPEIAENGAVVPVTVSSSLENVESISIIVPNNPRPMAATFEIPPGTLPNISSRIKMGETSDVIAVVKTNNGVYSKAIEVKVTIGGCGG
jgi:sulfur-oxidizing protein SoxY